MPAGAWIAHAEVEPKLEEYASALQHLWEWPQGAEVVEQCGYSLLLTDFLGMGLPYKQRLELITNALRAILEIAPCQALYWCSSEKLVDPQHYLEQVAQGQILHGALNMRFFNIQPEGSGRIVMDTVGLAALGVQDIQCDFHNLDSDMVAEFLFQAAHYLYENGDIIKDGNSFGLNAEQRWTCQHDISLISPQRLVLDLKPS